MRARVYLAGPDVFLPDARAIARRKMELCAEAGLEGLFPLDAELGDAPGWSDIFAANVDMIRSSDGCIANLTPFRGPSADAGTVAEMGILFGLGRPVFAYTNDARSLLERTVAALPESGRGEGDAVVDPDGHAIEDFGLADNLMLEGIVRASGGEIVRHPAAPDALWSDLSGFAECVRRAAGLLRRPQRGNGSD